MSDRLAVMSNGRVEQVGTPSEVYEDPATAYVADFLGVSNLMDVQCDGTDASGQAKVRLGQFDLAAAKGVVDLLGPAKATIRPERIRIEPQGTPGVNRIPGMIDRVVYVGSTLHVFVHLPSEQTLQVWIHNEGEALGYEQGTSVTVHLPVDALRVLPDTGVPAAVAVGSDDAGGS
jgi:ABC-type Fe3+/spermidine/putrescine transport system ATPase subunit